MSISIDRLSLWEIAHRWHNSDPSHSITIADIPLEVKDTLRNLAAEVYYERLYSTLLVEHEAKHHKPVFKRNWPYFLKKTWLVAPVSYCHKELKAVMNNEIDPVFLQSILIPFCELEYWCKEFQVPFPAFWLRSISHGGSIAAFPGAIEFSEAESDEPDEPESENNATPKKKTKSENHQFAAQQRHAPVNQLKRECVIYSLTQKGSNIQIAKRFYESLPDDRKKILSAGNAIRTLTQAISAYKKGADFDWLKNMPHP